MFKYYSPVDDAIAFFTTKVNKTMTNVDFLRTLNKNYPKAEKKLEQLLKPAIDLEKKLYSAFKSIDVDYEFLFKLDKNEDGDSGFLYNPAWLMFSYCSGRGAYSLDLTSAIKELRALKQYQRDVLFLSYLRELKAFSDHISIPSISEENCGQIIEIMRGLNIDVGIRTRLIELYVNFDEYVSRIETILRPAVELIVANEDLYIDDMKRNERIIDDFGGLRGLLKEKYNYSILDGIAERMHLSLLVPNSASIRDDIYNNVDAFFSMNEIELVDVVYSGHENHKLSTMFKMLSDETRLEILHSICKRPMYGLELADVFQISAPTVSYHMRKLGLAGFTESFFDGGRTYYRANIDNIKRFLQNFEDFLNGESEGA